MNLTKCRYPVEPRRIVIFGAGKIGRSFIGQLFGIGGYKVVFVDVDPEIVARLNSQGNYRIIIKAETDTEILVTNVEAIIASDIQKVTEAISAAGIMAVSVGKNALEKVIPLIAAGLELRYRRNPECPLDIIIAENMLEAGTIMKVRLQESLTTDFPLEKMAGLIETSIGKMVPVMTSEELKKDPLLVYAEPYNTLILDRKGFKCPIPEVKGLAPEDNIKAWVDRKAFIHNLGHATAAYYGFCLHPDAVYIYEVLDDNKVLRFTRAVMLQSADILRTIYPDDFTASDLEDHIDDLINRFRNKALKDTICRVGQDLARKLSWDDRFLGAIHLAIKNGKSYDLILLAMSYGFVFKAKDEKGNRYPADVMFLNLIGKDFEGTMTSLPGFNPVLDMPVLEGLKEIYKTNLKK